MSISKTIDHLFYYHFPGGLEESFDLTKMDRNEKAQLWQILFQGYKKNSIMGCSITVNKSLLNNSIE